jgi:hypothetical protein
MNHAGILPEKGKNIKIEKLANSCTTIPLMWLSYYITKHKSAFPAVLKEEGSILNQDP